MISKAAVACACVGISASGAGARQGGPPPANVRLGEVRLEPVERVREVTGQLRAIRRSLVASEEEGRVVSIEAEVGGRVNQGQVLARLDDSLARLAVARDEGLLASRRGLLQEREAELERAEREVRRYEELPERAASQSLLDEWKTNVQTARAKLAQAKADVVVAEASANESRRRLERLAIRAPFAGQVVERRGELGQWVRAGDVVAAVLSTERLEARLDVPEAIVPAVRGSNRDITLRLTALGREVGAAVTSVLGEGDPVSRLVPVRIELDNADGSLWAGMTLTGLVPTGEKGMSLTVPKDAMLRDDAGEYVYFDAGGMAMPARVTRRFTAGDRVVIGDGALGPGMRVVVTGNERMFPSQPLNVLNQDEFPAAPDPRGTPGGTGDAGAGGGKK